MTKEKFINEYGKLEEEVKQVYDLEMNQIDGIEDRNHPLYRHRSDMNMFRQTRNILVHNVKDENSKYITVNDVMAEKMREIREQVFGKIQEIGLKGKAIYSCQMSDKVMEAVATMNAEDYTHVPVLDDDGKVVGVFGENSLLRIFATGKAKDIASDTTFQAIDTYLARPGDRNVMFDFVRGDEFIHKCDKMFTNAHRRQCRLDILFITSDGTPNTPLEGLVTIWDLAGK